MVDDPAGKRGNAEDSANEHNGTRATNRDNLEKRLAEFASDIRANAADAEKRRRAATALETRVFAKDVMPPPSRGPVQLEDVKVVIAPGLDPRHEPTLVGRHDASRNRWDFATDGEIVDALDVPQPQGASVPLEQPRREVTTRRTQRARPPYLLLSLATGVLLVVPLLCGVLWPHEAKQASLPAVASAMATPTEPSGRATASEPLARQEEEGRIDTPESPAPSNAAPALPQNIGNAPSLGKPAAPQTKRSGGKPAAETKNSGPEPLGGRKRKF